MSVAAELHNYLLRVGPSPALLADHASLDRFIGLNLAEGGAAG